MISLTQMLQRQPSWMTLKQAAQDVYGKMWISNSFGNFFDLWFIDFVFETNLIWNFHND
jgi:hypothetical protein